MIAGALVIDAAVHAFNFGVDNMKTPFMREVVTSLHALTMHQLHPQGAPEYYLSKSEFQAGFMYQPALLEEALFAESQCDIAVYHGVPMYGFFNDGSSPLHIGAQIKRKLPHRIHLFGDVSPWAHDPIERVDELVEDYAVSGLKFYPMDLVDGQPRLVDFRDEARMFPIIEHAAKRGIDAIALHKAVPLGAATPRQAFHVDDVANTLEAFPNVKFEIVHGGFAFADQTADLLEAHPNVAINLESNPCFSLNHVEKFAAMMEPLLRTGALDRLFFATGATGVHPRPFIEAFCRYQPPPGYSALSERDKAAILGVNYARWRGWDVEGLKAKCRADVYGLENKSLRAPWGPLRAAAGRPES